MTCNTHVLHRVLDTVYFIKGKLYILTVKGILFRSMFKANDYADCVQIKIYLKALKALKAKIKIFMSGRKYSRLGDACLEVTPMQHLLWSCQMPLTFGDKTMPHRGVN